MKGVRRRRKIRKCEEGSREQKKRRVGAEGSRRRTEGAQGGVCRHSSPESCQPWLRWYPWCWAAPSWERRPRPRWCGNRRPPSSWCRCCWFHIAAQHNTKFHSATQHQTSRVFERCERRTSSLESGCGPKFSSSSATSAARTSELCMAIGPPPPLTGSRLLKKEQWEVSNYQELYWCNHSRPSGDHHLVQMQQWAFHMLTNVQSHFTDQQR